MMNIYRERERERERDTYQFDENFYRQRERERYQFGEIYRKRERESQRGISILMNILIYRERERGQGFQS